MSESHGTPDKEHPRSDPAAGGSSGSLDVPPQRQPSPPVQAGGPPARPPYEVEARLVPRPAPGPGQRFTSWWSRPSTILVFLLVLVVLLASTAILAALALTGDTPTAAVASPSPTPSPTPTAQVQTPEPPGVPTASAAPSAPATGGPADTAAPGGGGVELPPTPADTVGVRYQGGTHEEQWPGADQRYDFDGASVFAGHTNGDVALTEYGIVGVNGVGFAAFPGKERPQLGGCASIPRERWVLDIPTPEVKAGATYCFATNEGRYGYLTVRAGELDNAGQLNHIAFIFLVWEGPND